MPVTGYNIACLILTLLTASFIPAIIASNKNHRFSKWYAYSVFVFPLALVHALMIRKPRHYIGVYVYDKKNPSKRSKKLYAVPPQKKRRIVLSIKYLCAVFFSKLIFGAFTAIACFAVFRTFADDTASLRISCVIFALVFSVLLSVVEIFRLSAFPMMADEITKRAIITAFLCFVCSASMLVVKVFVLDNILPQHPEFVMFVCTLTSFVLFVVALLSQQRKYYSFFHKFSDYCIISLCAYTIFAAATLICISLTETRGLEGLIAMPMQIFSLDYLSGVGYIKDISHIYSVALVHLIIEVIILISGLMCRDYKRKELAFRVEYRSRAFRMSRRRILRRHIPGNHMMQVKPLHKV